MGSTLKDIVSMSTHDWLRFLMGRSNCPAWRWIFVLWYCCSCGTPCHCVIWVWTQWTNENQTCEKSIDHELWCHYTVNRYLFLMTAINLSTSSQILVQWWITVIGNIFCIRCSQRYGYMLSFMVESFHPGSLTSQAVIILWRPTFQMNFSFILTALMLYMH